MSELAGWVYRARDTRLSRDVAIKVLPDVLSADADRRVRFEREAQVLASLNHPGIATIFGVGESSNHVGHVMELVEGPTLAERLAGGGLPIEESVAIGRQICEALEYAHDRGVVHRDLKRANVKIKPDGTIKILDFGLAKALAPDAAQSLSPANATHSPTLGIGATQAFVILGTAAYMAPEQARGVAVDRRADIWAFGCVRSCQRAAGNRNECCAARSPVSGCMVTGRHFPCVQRRGRVARFVAVTSYTRWIRARAGSNAVQRAGGLDFSRWTVARFYGR